MFCAISGVAPVVPVVSKTSGLVYEKELVLKYIRDNDGKDPITGEALAEDDLLELKTSPSAPAAPPRPPSLTSIPALLHTLQNEWDAAMLEVHQLRKTAQQLRQDLSHALYKEDAAIRVLARVMRERDEAREALANVHTTLGLAPPSNGAAQADATMDVDVPQAAPGLTGSALERHKATAQSLSAVRKKRKVSPDDAKPDDIKAYAQTEAVPSMHSTKPPGISALDVTKGGSLWLTGGVDKTVQVYDRAEGKTVANLKGHGKRVTSVAFVDQLPADAEGLPQLLVSASQDKTIRLWTPIDAKSRSKSAYSAGATISTHTDEVTAIAVHPCRSILASTSFDGTWALHDLENVAEPTTLLTGSLPAETGGASIAFHPDGIFFAVGTSNAAIAVYETESGRLAHTFEAPANSGAVVSISFSENGYLLATASAAGPSQVWDLRKLKLVSTVAPAGEGAVVQAVAWDPSAQYLAEAGTSLRIFQNKAWDAPLLSFEENAAELTSVAWAGKEVVVAGLDRSVRVLARP